MLTIPAAVTQMKTEFERARRWRRGRHEPMQFGDFRWQALDRFLALGFPTTADQEWRFTDMASIAGKLFTLALPRATDEKYIDLLPPCLPGDCAAELVFVNGCCVPQASTLAALPPGARVEPLSQALDSSATDVVSYLGRLARFEHRAFVALNTALFSDGGCIMIPPDTIVEKPIGLRFISTGEADMRPAISNPRVLVLLGKGSRAAVIETFVGKESVEYFTNAVTEIVLAENAGLDHYKLQRESMQAYHISATNVCAASGAHCSRHYIGLGGDLARDEVAVLLAGEGAKCTLNGLSVVNGGRLADTHTTIEHARNLCSSRQLCHGIAGDHGKTVVDCTEIVRAGAERTDTKQTSRTLLLSDDARVDAASRFENSAGAVGCIQRAICRRIDEQARFYVRSRNFGVAEARRLATLGFAQTMLNRMPLQQVAHGLAETIFQQLEPMLARLT